MRKIIKGYKMCQNFTASVSRVLREIDAYKGKNMDTLKSVELPRSRPFTVVVEGNIGSGKTTFLEHFKKFSDEVELIAEPVEKWRNIKGHNLLQMMYEDPARWSLTFQTYVQLTMLQNHTKDTNKNLKLMERSIFSAKYCFVENLMKSGKMPLSEYEVLSGWFDFLLSSPQVDLGVDLIVYMRTSPEVALSRLMKRGRGEEHLIAKQYIDDLHQLHEDWLVNGKYALPAPVIVVDADKDLEEMREVFSRQEKMLLKSARLNQKCDDEKENIAASGGFKRVAGYNDTDDGGRKVILLEKGQL